MIVEAGWDLMVKWTKAHTAKASKAEMIAEQKQIALVTKPTCWQREERNVMAPSSPKDLHGTLVKPRKRDMLRLSMKLVFMRRIKIMKMWKIQEEAKAKVQMVFAEITQEGTDGKTCMCVAYGKRSMFEKSSWHLSWLQPPRCDNKVYGDHGARKVLGLRLSVC